MSSVRHTVDLIGTHEIADMLGVSRQRVHQLAALPDFPKPVRRTGPRAPTIWLRKDIERWMKSTGRPLLDDEES